MKKAFTLLEINLAILVMSIGVLSIIGLYSLAYRENRQSREDVASAAYADAVFGPLVTALSATNVKWSVFRELKCYPSSFGWADYFQNKQTGQIVDHPESTARQVYANVLGDLALPGFPTGWPVSDIRAGNLKAALVVMHDRDDAVVTLSFRAAAKVNMLMSAPMYFTAVRFQGVRDDMEGTN